MFRGVGAQMLNVLRSFLSATFLALAFSVGMISTAGAHHTADSFFVAPRVALTRGVEASLTGTVGELVVENRVTNATTRYSLLRVDGGKSVALSGDVSGALMQGARVSATGTFTGETLSVRGYESLSTTQSTTSSTATSDSAQGTLLLAHADDFENDRSEFRMVVRGDDGQATELNLAALPSTLQTGMSVVAYGARSADRLSMDVSRVEITSAPSSKFAAQEMAKAQSLTTNSVLMILVKFAGSTEPFTPAEVTQVMKTNANSVANYYNEVSYGQQALNVTVTSAWLQTNLDPTKAPVSTCDFSTIHNAADTAAMAAGYNVASYTNRYYVFAYASTATNPTARVPCGWSGLAYVGYGEAYSNAYNQLGVYGHELGHNFGLLHAASLRCTGQAIGGTCSASEYGDPFDVMGNISGMHFNAMQKSLLQWIPASSVKTHSGGTQTYALTPIESPSGASYAVKIPALTNRTYWVEYRQPLGFDSGLSAGGAGAQIRVASPFETTCSGCGDDTELLDMTPATTTFSDAALQAGQVFNDTANNISVSVLSQSPTLLTLQVSAAAGTATTTTLATSLTPATVGSLVTLTATVTGNAPTGTVNFVDGGASIGGCSAVTLVGSGNSRTAACAISSLAVATHSIVAAYSGGAGNTASNSATLSQVVNKATGTTTMVSSLNPATAGSSVTFTATVAGISPTGSVNFKDGSTSISGCSTVALAGTGNSRTAQCTTSTLATGTHSVTAAYTGDASNLASTSAALSQGVNTATAPSTTTLASSAAPSTFGSTVTFTATVVGTAPTGTVTFAAGGATITGCSAVALAGTGNSKTAACATSTLPVGTQSIVASYSGGTGNNASTSSPLSQLINKAIGTATLSSSANPAGAGASVTFTAAVAGIAPTGTVGFTSGGTSISGCSAVALAGSGNARTAGCTTSALTAGTHSIVANYTGDGNNAADSSPALSQAITASGGSTNFALASNGGVASASSSYSSSYPVAAINNNNRSGTGWGAGGGWNDGTSGVFPDWVQIDFNGSKTIDHIVLYTLQDNYLSPVEPTDTMTFSVWGITAFNVQGWNGSAWVTLGTVSGNNLVKRTVTFTPFVTTRVRINITAALGSYSRIIELEAWGTAAVGPAAATTTLASSANPSTSGSSITFTATVVGAAPTGSVKFSDGATAIASCSAITVAGSGNSKTAQCTTSGLSVGTHNIVASYSGDASNGASNSAALSQGVNASGSTSVNVALASNGAVATASSAYGAGYGASSVNDNIRSGVSWGNGGGWADGTADAFPDWVQIKFSATKTIGHVVVYTVQDNYATPVEPTDTMTFSKYGVTAFTVQGWNGSAWIKLATVTGNNLVKRTVTFSPYATTKIRINVTAALNSYSRIVEIEAWGN